MKTLEWDKLMRPPSLVDLITKKRNHWKTAFLSLVAGVAGVAGVVGVAGWQQTNQTLFVPVKKDFIAIAQEVTPTRYIALVIGTKFGCVLIANSQAGWAYDGVWRKTGFEFITDPSPNYSRLPGHQSFGLWSWEIKKTDSSVRLSIRHNCDDIIITSIIGPFQIR